MGGLGENLSVSYMGNWFIRITSAHLMLDNINCCVSPRVCFISLLKNAQIKIFLRIVRTQFILEISQTPKKSFFLLNFCLVLKMNDDTEYHSIDYVLEIKMNNIIKQFVSSNQFTGREQVNKSLH